MQTSWVTNHETLIMNLFLILMLKKLLKLLVINFNFSQFHEHIFKSSRSQMFFKIGALKNYAIQNYELKRDTNTDVLLEEAAT